MIDLFIYLNIYYLLIYLVIYYLNIYLFSSLFYYLFIYFITYNLITYMCGLLMHDCRRPNAPPGWYTTATWHNGKGGREVDGPTL